MQTQPSADANPVAQEQVAELVQKMAALGLPIDNDLIANLIKASSSPAAASDPKLRLAVEQSAQGFLGNLAQTTGFPSSGFDDQAAPGSRAPENSVSFEEAMRNITGGGSDPRANIDAAISKLTSKAKGAAKGVAKSVADIDTRGFGDWSPDTKQGWAKGYGKEMNPVHFRTPEEAQTAREANRDGGAALLGVPIPLKKDTGKPPLDIVGGIEELLGLKPGKDDKEYPNLTLRPEQGWLQFLEAGDYAPDAIGGAPKAVRGALGRVGQGVKKVAEVPKAALTATNDVIEDIFGKPLVVSGDTPVSQPPSGEKDTALEMLRPRYSANEMIFGVPEDEMPTPDNPEGIPDYAEDAPPSGGGEAGEGTRRAANRDIYEPPAPFRPKGAGTLLNEDDTPSDYEQQYAKEKGILLRGERGAAPSKGFDDEESGWDKMLSVMKKLSFDQPAGQGMLAAGLGILGAQNTYGSTAAALGRGGLVGLGAYNQERDRIAAEEYKKDALAAEIGKAQLQYGGERTKDAKAAAAKKFDQIMEVFKNHGNDPAALNFGMRTFFNDPILMREYPALGEMLSQGRGPNKQEIEEMLLQGMGTDEASTALFPGLADRKGMKEQLLRAAVAAQGVDNLPPHLQNMFNRLYPDQLYNMVTATALRDQFGMIDPNDMAEVVEALQTRMGVGRTTARTTAGPPVVNGKPVTPDEQALAAKMARMTPEQRMRYIDQMR